MSGRGNEEKKDLTILQKPVLPGDRGISFPDKITDQYQDNRYNRWGDNSPEHRKPTAPETSAEF